MVKTLIVHIKGGAGSGNWGHAGRPGLVGGSGGSGMGFGVGSVGTHDPNHPSTQKASDMLDDGLPASEMNHDIVALAQSWQEAEHNARSFAKQEIINELADRTGVDPDDVSDYIKQWTESSNDSDMRSLAIQKDAAEELGLEMSDWQQRSIDTLNERVIRRENAGQDMSSLHFADLRPLLPSTQQRQLIRAMYDNTQERLAAHGFSPDDTVRLYRGVALSVDWPNGGIVNYQGNAIESWSIGRDVAHGFARKSGGYMIEMDVPVRNIVGTARSGFGCLNEGEFIVAGNIPGQQARIIGKSTMFAMELYKNE